mmetsp:Transcript_10797/g.34259  ORF Transcript_10797/g.34259 Transcript_10797/m.34259 type:complete len:342 (+) Transcript_10797:1531-2556(+)
MVASVASGTTKPSSPLAYACSSLRESMSSEFLSYCLKTARTRSSSARALARVSMVDFVFAALSTRAPHSRLQLAVLWRSCGICCLASAPSAGFAGACFMMGWCTRKNSEQPVASLSTSAPASLRLAAVASTSWMLSSFSAAKASTFSLSSPLAFSAASTRSFSSSSSFPAFSSASCFFLNSSSFFSSSLRFISFTWSIRFWTCATTDSHSSWSCCALSPTLGSSFSRTSSSSFLISSKFSTFATRIFCCNFRISVAALISCCLFSITSLFCLSSSSCRFFISSCCFFTSSIRALCSSAFRFISASCSSFRLRLASSTLFLFSSILILISSCFLRFSSKRCW